MTTNSENRAKELETILTKECSKHENDCNNCPYSKQCDEYAKLYNK